MKKKQGVIGFDVKDYKFIDLNQIDSVYVDRLQNTARYMLKYEDGKEIDVKTLEEEEDKEGTPLSIEEIDNVSMVKPKESVEVITEKEAENDSESELLEEQEDDYEAEIEDQLDELDDSLMEGDEE